MSDTILNLVADIGGTNIRIGIARPNGEVSSIEVYQCREFATLAAAIRFYWQENHLSGNKFNACLAIACPVDNDLVTMTNHHWSFSKKALQEELGLNKLIVINDYTAIAHSIPVLSDEQRYQIGHGEIEAGRPISICGPGTGLGVANLIPIADNWHVIGGEGGHVDFAPVDEQESKILEHLLSKYQHVSYEQLLSGLGIEQIYQAICAIKQVKPEALAAHEISAKALQNDCDLCEQALLQFCKTLGSFAGNLALTMSSFGGVYIAGGIAPRMIEFIEKSEFRSRFEAKGRLSGFNHKVPTFVITEAQPGILGASAYLRQHNKEDV